MSDVSRLLSIRARWTPESAEEFLRNVIVPAAMGKRIGGATDAAAPEPHEPTIAGSEWMTTSQPDAAGMQEASRIASLYEGVSPEIGRKRFDEYLLQRGISNAGK